MRSQVWILLVCVVACLAIAAPSYAQGPTQDAYGGVLGQQGDVGSSGPAAGIEQGAQQGAEQGGAVKKAGSSGRLPFTGLQLGLVLVAGTGLLGGGLVVRRMTRRQATA